MTMKHATIEDYEGVGVYERFGPRGPADDAFTYGVYTRLRRGPARNLPAPDAESAAFGVYASVGQTSLPGEAELLGTLLDTEERSGLVAVKNDKRAYAVQALEVLHFQQTSAQGVDPIVGQASYILGSGSQQWVTSLTSQGWMVMIATASVPSGAIQVIATKDPKTIAYYATAAQGYAMVDGPAELAVAAQNYKLASSCPAGTSFDSATGQCKSLAQGGSSTAAAKASAGTPEWVVPVAIGAGVLVVGYLILKK
jgi:hypothetical protein